MLICITIFINSKDKEEFTVTLPLIIDFIIMKD